MCKDPATRCKLLHPGGQAIHGILISFIYRYQPAAMIHSPRKPPWTTLIKAKHPGCAVR